MGARGTRSKTTVNNTHYLQLFLGDCLEVMRTFEDNSVDALVTDPPAGISFMGRDWDADKGGRAQWVAWLSEVMREALRVVKPGGHAFVWALPRTSHWTALALEDAGWQIREKCYHIFGSGFPKSLDVGKAFDRMAGAKREVVGRRTDRAATPRQDIRGGRYIGGGNGMYDGSAITAPATDLARQWDGWGTALKPSAEEWILCRKPLSEASVAANVQRWVCGALNIAACRVGYNAADGDVVLPSRHNVTIGGNGIYGGGVACETGGHPAGRWPANILLSHSPGCRKVGVKRVRGHNGGPPGKRQAKSMLVHGGGNGTTWTDYADANGMETVQAWECAADCPVRLLDEQSGERQSGVLAPHHCIKARDNIAKGREAERHREQTFGGDTGGASRFFPQFPPDASTRFRYVSKASRRERTEGGRVVNGHPTIKPRALCRWLCRLICPPGGTVLDPFMGSGSVGVAALDEGFKFIGIEKEEEYFRTAQERIAIAEAIPLMVST